MYFADKRNFHVYTKRCKHGSEKKISVRIGLEAHSTEETRERVEIAQKIVDKE